MSDTQQVVDGWYKVTRPLQEDDFEKVVDRHVDYGDGASVESCLDWGYTFAPAICMTVAEHDALQAELATLRAQVQELQAWLDGSRNNEDIALDMLGKLNDIIATLRAQVQEVEAGQWVVASDGEYAVNGVIRLVVKGPTVEFWNKLQHLITIGMYSESVAICTRKPQEGAQPSDNYFETNEPRDNERWKDPEY